MYKNYWYVIFYMNFILFRALDFKGQQIHWEVNSELKSKTSLQTLYNIAINLFPSFISNCCDSERLTLKISEEKHYSNCMYEFFYRNAKLL